MAKTTEEHRNHQRNQIKIMTCFQHASLFVLNFWNTCHQLAFMNESLFYFNEPDQQSKFYSRTALKCGTTTRNFLLFLGERGRKEDQRCVLSSDGSLLTNIHTCKITWVLKSSKRGCSSRQCCESAESTATYFSERQKCQV